ncbi:Merlin [Hypsibius exemplaris]|uniref:Moesin/ezrin/radixin homolog 1 n=1 Tax=Hypsibius exemplaris TaxID=2072580 RepID=A0A1W0WXF7_HYPEX|nr:Merlin [Hypsibius exemplaris]
MSRNGRIRDKNILDVCIRMFDAELQFTVPKTSTGRDLFDQVCRAIGLRETWYFGLRYEDDRRFMNWVKMRRPLLKQSGLSETASWTFHLLVRFYPEDVGEELVQEITRHLFFLQIRQAILDSVIYCPPEEAILLASYDAQVTFGDFDDISFEPGMFPIQNLLPVGILEQFGNTSREAWESRIRQLHTEHYGLSRGEAELEHLKVAQNLAMFGVGYFSITNKIGSEVYLGVTAFGLNIYEKHERQIPSINFPWSEIKNVSYEDTKFIIRPLDKKAGTFTFHSPDLKLNKVILELCIGNHDLFLRRRKPDTIEIQQMKMQAKEERTRRQHERHKLLKEKQLREDLQREKQELQRQLIGMQDEVRTANEEMARCQETAEVMAQKAKYAQDEAALIDRKAMEAEKQVQQLKLTVLQSEQERMEMERKVRDAEQIASKMVEQAERLSAESEKYREEMRNAKALERIARDRLAEVGRSSMISPQEVRLESAQSYKTPPGYQSRVFVEGPVLTSDQIALELERENLDYLQKKQTLQEQLKELRSEIEIIKTDDSLNGFLSVDVNGLRKEKFATLQKASAGSTKMRISHFENL